VTVALTAPEGALVEAIETAIGERPVLLTGSRAFGAETSGSDWDVAVVVPPWRVPLALRSLARTARSLEPELGARVSISPLSSRLLRQDERLFVWKLRREAKLLAAPAAFALEQRPAPLPTQRSEFSYLMSAVFYLLDDLEPAALAADQLPERLRRGLGKALLHVLQLRLLRKGLYVSRLDQALATEERAVDLTDPVAWFSIRAEVIRELSRVRDQPDGLRALLRNGEYAVLSALRGSLRLKAAASLRPVERRLADAAVELLMAPTRQGTVDAARVEAAAAVLPRALRPVGDWWHLRDLVAREWANAHPLLGL
jgi:predicted nucleotidyltransferase